VARGEEPGEGRSPLANVALFARCSAEELAAMSARLRRRSYARGQVIFQEGHQGTALYVIECGRVKLGLSSPEGKEVIFDLLGPGDFFGELALLDGEPRSADATALDPCDLLVLDRVGFHQQLAQQPRMASSLLAVLSRRLRRDARLMSDAAFLDVPARLARVLLNLAESSGHPTSDGVMLDCRLTQTDLAGLVGSSRVSVNKWLQVFCRQGLITQVRGRVTVRQADRLRELLS